MQKTRRILSFLLTLCMMLTVALPLTVNAASITFNDVPANHTYFDAITTLAAEGILNGFEDGSFKSDDPVTRAQFTKVICYALGVGDIQYGEASRVSFPDVDPNHWAIDNITTAYNSKIINGYDDGTFKPDESVLYEQAVKMAVCALGYPEERALRNGGYPNGYIKIASDIKMLKGLVDVKVGQPLTRGGVAQLVDRMRDADIYTDTESSDVEQGSLRENEQTQTLQVSGRVVSIYGTSIYHDETSQCRRQQIELELTNGNREFFGIENLGVDSADMYLGKSVTVYYEHDSGASYDEATNIVFQSKKNREVSVYVDDILTASATNMEYYDVDKEVETDIDISTDICILLNGVAVNNSFTNVVTYAKSLEGYVTLLCSQDNDVADVAFVTTYDSLVVHSKDTKNYKVYAYNNAKSFTLDETDYSKTITFTKDGKPSKFSEIGTGNTVSVSTSGDGKKIDVQISSKTAKGSITEILSNGNFKIGNSNKEYRLSKNCSANGTIAPGSYITFYIDAFGNVANYDVSAEQAYQFGYLSWAEGGTVTKAEVRIKVYSMNAYNGAATGKIYSLNESVRIDDTRYSVTDDEDDILNYFRTTAGKANINVSIPDENGDPAAPTNTDFAQPIRFTTSSTSVIDKILTTESTGEFSVSMNMEYHMSTPVLCRADKTTLGNYSIPNTVPVLFVPQDRTSDTYKTSNHSCFDKDESYYVQVVNVSSSKQPQAIYLYGTASGGADVSTATITEDHIPMIVTDVATVTYKDEVRKRLKLLGTDGVATEVYDDSRAGTELISSLVVGDIIRVATDDDKLVHAIELLASAVNVAGGTQPGFIKVDGTGDTTDLRAPFRVILGEVSSVYQGSIRVLPSFDPESTDPAENYTYTDDIKVFMIDTHAANTNNIVTESVFGEVTGRTQQGNNASKVMIYSADGNAKAIIIIK